MNATGQLSPVAGESLAADNSGIASRGAAAARATRVMLVTGEYPPTIGGVGDYTATLAAHLRDAGADAAVLTGVGAVLPNDRAVRRTVPDWGLRGWPAINRAIAATRPEVVHIQYQAGAFAGRGGIVALPWWLARRSNVPVVVTFHDRCVPYLFPKAGPLRAFALRTLARGGAATVVTNGDDWAAFRADWETERRLHLIPIGSNIPALPADERGAVRAATRATRGIGPNTLVIAYFGLLSASKGVDLLLDAVADAAAYGLSDFRLLLIGGETSATDGTDFGAAGDLRGALRAHDLTECVIITGALPAAAVAAHLAAADLAVLPYRDGASWRRGSLLAALAAGVPTITTVPEPGYAAAGSLPTLTDRADVRLVPASDARALAAAIARLAADPAERARLAAGGQAIAARFDWSAIAKTHLDLYASLIQRAGRQRGGGR